MTLDLDGEHPPKTPVRYLPPTTIRFPPELSTWVREQAHIERTSFNSWLVRLVRRERDGQLPADCRDWLARQAAQCGCPGDLDRALVLVLRHLADRWPDGARLK